MAVLAAAAVVAFSMAPVAGAAIVRHQLFELGEIPAEGPHGEQIALPGPLGKMESMTVDSGHLWVAEGFLGQPSRVDEFDAKTGAFIGQPIHLPATPATEETLPSCYGEGCGEGIAVAHAFGEAEVYLGGELHGVSVVSVFDEAGALKATWNGTSVPGGTFGIKKEGARNSGTVSAVAVDNSTSPLDLGAGNVYVTTSVGGTAVIDVFHPEVNGEERYVGQITGISASTPFHYIKSIGVEPNGDLLVDDSRPPVGNRGEPISSLDVFEPTMTPGDYAFVRAMTGPPPSDTFGSVFTLAIDASTGEIDLADFSPEGYRIEQFSAAGAYLGHVDNIPDAFAIAVDPATHYLYARQAVYGPGVVLPDVTTDPPVGLKPESAVLSGTVNPDNAGNASCQFEWGTTPALGNTAPCSTEVSNSESAEDVQAPLSGLERGVTYYYRLEASNENGTNHGERWQTRSFTTTGAIIRADSASDVSADSATLLATIDPANQPTSYYFEYGTSAEYGRQIPATAESIGSGNADVEVAGKRLQGLSPETEYHYRLVVLSEANGEPETVYSPDHTFTTQSSTVSSALPDGRAWELVTPAEKHGALFFAQNVAQLGSSTSPFVAESSIDGNAMIDLASAPTEAQPPGNGVEVSVLSVRGSEGWSSKVLAPPHRGGTGPSLSLGSEYKFFSEDLSRGVVEPFGPFLALSPEANEPTPYLHSNYLKDDVNQPCESSCYRPLVTSANTSGVPFGEEVEPGAGCIYICGPGFVDATPDASYVALDTFVQLTSAPYTKELGLHYYYEWGGGHLQPLFLLPAGEGGMGVSAGEVDSAKHQLADNGSVFFAYKGHMYLHDFEHETAVRLDVAQGVSEPSGGGSAVFLYASSDGSRVLFSDSKQLTSAEGGGIYECRIVENGGVPGCELTLTPLTGGELIGGAKDASYLYFSGPSQRLVVAHYVHGVWTSATGPYIGSFIHGPTFGGSLPSPLTEVGTATSPDGRYLTFMSSQELAGYDSHDARSGRADVEVYLYDAVANKLVCASCNPTGSRPTGVPLAALDLVAGSVDLDIGGKGFTNEEVWVAANLPPWTTVEPSHVNRYQPRFLSDSGRLFFNASDALVPQDVNGQQDVYEYEPPGVGDCVVSSTTYSARSGGCVRLVSSGSSAEESAFMDASESGGDVFFITLSKLTSQDFDNALDVYDAHECTDALPCPPVVPASPPPCKTGDSCKAAPTPQPSIFGEPSSATFSGSGNVPVGGTTPGPGKVKPRASGASRLERALRACRKKHGKRRVACERGARKRYGKLGASHKAQVRRGKRG